MSENTPDPATFDIADWLVGGTNHRPTKTVTVYRDLSLYGQIEDIRERIEARDRAVTDSEGNPEESIGGGDDGKAELEAEAEALLEKMRAAKVTITITGLIGPEEDEVGAELKAQGHDRGGIQWTYHVLARAAEFPGGQRLTPEQWAQFHGVIGQGQFIRITKAYQEALLQVPDVSAPFSRGASRKGTGR